MGLREVIHELPLKAGFALFEAIRSRREVDDGNSYVDRQARKAANEMKQYLEQTYEVI